ncbi:MAG TPA: hypothetical protein P5267_03605, partial [Patescibacteria group bacterium]|nr:hypothetical protein [Patescibacteria group bacterium]
MNQHLSLYHELLRKHGAPAGQWGLWCRRPKTIRQREEVIIGAILTQNTNWQNVNKAMENLKRARVCSLKLILELKIEKLEELIRPSGFYKMKAKYLQGVAKFIVESGGVGRLMEFNYNIYQHHPLPPPQLRRGKKKTRGNNTDELRREFLKLKGVGPETADSILLYALDMPVFVIDEYTRRLVKARGWFQHQSSKLNLEPTYKLDYEYLRKLFEKNLPRKFEVYQDLHALIVV